MSYPLVLDLAADGIPVAVTCRVLGFSKQAFYKWKANPVSDRDRSDAHLINAALDIHRDDPAFGYRFIADELPAQGIRAGENRVQRLCSSQRIWSVFAKKRGLNRRAGPPVRDDLVGREYQPRESTKPGAVPFFRLQCQADIPGLVTTGRFVWAEPYRCQRSGVDGLVPRRACPLLQPTSHVALPLPSRTGRAGKGCW